MHLGLTGTIGSGKSSVLNFFKNNGWETFNCDEFCRKLHMTPRSELIQKIEQRWGKDYLLPDGTSDKIKIAELVFNNQDERNWLNSIIHPIVKKEMKNRADKSKKLISEVPLLFEVGWEKYFDSTICVWSPANLIFSRLLKKGLSKTQIVLRIEAQYPQEKKLEMADIGLINSKDLAFLQIQSIKIINSLKNIS